MIHAHATASTIPMFPKHQKLLRTCTHPIHLHQIHASMIKTATDTLPFQLSKLLASSVVIHFPHALSIFATIPRPNLYMFNSVLRGHSLREDPQPHHAISLLNSLRSSGLALDHFSFIATLKCCARAHAAAAGEPVHGIAVTSGLHGFLNLRNAIVSFYCECGMVGSARKLFDEMLECRDAVSWSALMSGYLRVYRYDAVLGLFREMRSSGLEITPAAVLIALSAASNEGMGSGECENVHGFCIKAGLSLDSKIASSMMTAYGRSGLVNSAWTIFETVPEKDIVVWNCMVDGYARNGSYGEAYNLLEKMKDEGIRPNESTLSSLLSACASSGDLHMGRRIHEYMEAEMSEMNAIVVTALVDMYSCCGWVDKAVEIFKQVRSQDVKLWTAMINAFGAHGQSRAALQLFHRMVEEGLRPNEVTFLAVLSACNHGGLVVSGQECFKRMVQEYNYKPNAMHYGCVIDLLGRAGMLNEAHELIEGLPVSRDIVAWRALLSSCRVHGDVELGELARQRLVELGDEHPTDSILLSRTYALAGQTANAVFASCGVGTKKEAGWSVIDISG